MKALLHSRLIKAIGLLVFVFMVLLIVNDFRSNPLVEYVEYYGQILPRTQFDAQGRTRYCGQITLTPIESFQRLLAHGPQFMCFDTQAELNDWLKATGHPPF